MSKISARYKKYDLSLCQTRLHTASETFVCHKKMQVKFDFLRFSFYSAFDEMHSLWH